jgi:hypothetical protein
MNISPTKIYTGNKIYFPKHSIYKDANVFIKYCETHNAKSKYNIA